MADFWMKGSLAWKVSHTTDCPALLLHTSEEIRQHGWADCIVTPEDGKTPEQKQTRASGYWHLNGNALYNARNATFRTILKRIALQFSEPMDLTLHTNRKYPSFDQKKFKKISKYGYDSWLASSFRQFSNPKSKSVLRQWYVDAAAKNPATYPPPDTVFYDYLLVSPYLRNFHPTVGATWKMFQKLTDWHTGPHVTNETYFIHGGHEMAGIMEDHKRDAKDRLNKIETGNPGGESYIHHLENRLLHSSC